MSPTSQVTDRRPHGRAYQLARNAQQADMVPQTSTVIKEGTLLSVCSPRLSLRMGFQRARNLLKKCLCLLLQGSLRHCVVRFVGACAP